MAAITVTPANVAFVSGGINKESLAGEAFDAGDIVYLKSSTGKWMKAQADGTDEESGVGVEWGIAINTGVLNQFAHVQTGGIVNPGGTVVVGTVYLVGTTAGDIVPNADITTTGHYKSIFGIGTTSSRIDMSIKKATGVTMP